LQLELVALQEEDFNLGLIGFEDEELRDCSPPKMPRKDLPMKTRCRTFRKRRFPRRAISGFLGTTNSLLAMQQSEPISSD
jgi:hypothetical protein